MVINTFLVEDKTDIRDTLVSAMEELVPLHFVGVAATETAARQWLGIHNDAWDLAIVDLSLAEGTGFGFGVLKDCQVRKPQQKVIVFTSHCQQNILHRCRELGADEIFNKTEEVKEMVLFCRAHAENLG